MLVKGGNRMYGVNRMRERSSELEKVPDEICAKYDFSKCKSLEEVRDLLQEMVNLDYHLVGTREYVYHSNGMMGELRRVIFMVESDEPPTTDYSWSLFTRTNEFRATVAKLSIEKEEDG